MLVATFGKDSEECVRCGIDLSPIVHPDGDVEDQDTMTDLDTDDVYCVPCGSDVEEFDYEQATRYNTTWA